MKLTIPVYAADTLGETMTLDIPEQWHPMVESIAECGATSYGPNYDRAVTETLFDLTRDFATDEKYAVKRLMGCLERTSEKRRRQAARRRVESESCKGS